MDHQGVLRSKRHPARPQHHSHLKWIWTLKVQFLSPCSWIRHIFRGPQFLGAKPGLEPQDQQPTRPCKLGRSIWSHLLLRLLMKELKQQLLAAAQDGLHACGEGFQWQRNGHHGDQKRAPGNYLLSGTTLHWSLIHGATGFASSSTSSMDHPPSQEIGPTFLFREFWSAWWFPVFGWWVFSDKLSWVADYWTVHGS